MNTLAEIKTHLGIDTATDAVLDPNLTILINSATKYIENKLSRVIVQNSAVIEEVTAGDVEKCFSNYCYLNNPKINSVTTIKKYNYDTDVFDAWLVTANVKNPQSEFSCKITLKGGEVFETNQLYQITYDCGYAVASVPADLKLAHCMLCNDFYNNSNLAGNDKNRLGVVSFADTNIQNSTTQFKDVNIEKFINPYKNLNI